MVEQIPPEIIVGVLSAIVGVLSAGSALGGTYLQSHINLKAQEKAIEAQDRRASADYFLRKEADAFIELLETAESCHAITYQYVNQVSAKGEASDELREDLNEALAEFEAAARTKTVFLDDEDQKAVNDLLGTIQKTAHGGDLRRQKWGSAGEELIDWEELMNNFDEFQTRMSRLTQERIQNLRD